MTYKAIVKEMIRREADKWIHDLLEEHEISHRYISAEVVDMHIDKDSDCILWEVMADVYGAPGYGLLGYTKVYAGGCADNLIGICPSVIWSADKKTIIWMASEETREDLGITEFHIS